MNILPRVTMYSAGAFMSSSNALINNDCGESRGQPRDRSPRLVVPSRRVALPAGPSDKANNEPPGTIINLLSPRHLLEQYRPPREFLLSSLVAEKQSG